MGKEQPDKRGLDVLVLGDINPDVVVADADPGPEFGQHERLVEAISLTVGGSCAILAAGAARLGLRVAVIGVVGDDALGRFMLTELAARTVDVSAVRIDPDLPTGASVILARPTDRAIITASGTIAALRADDVPLDLVARSRHLHIASYYLQSGLQPDMEDIFRHARSVGTTTSIDPNWDPDERWDAGLRGLLPLTDIFMPNEEEALRIAGQATIEAAAHALAAMGPQGAVVAIKRGGNGAVAVGGGDPLVTVAAYPIVPVDSTGAGDSFDAALLAALLEGRALRDALTFAVVCGALSTRAVGGTDTQPTRGEADAALGEWAP